MLTTNRGLLKYILFNILTLGIYSLFFIHNVASDMNTACREDGKHTRGLFMFCLLSFVTCGIYSLVWMYGICERCNQKCARMNVISPVNGGEFVLWSLVGSLLCGLGPFIAMHKMIKGVNTACGLYNSHLGQMNGGMGGMGGMGGNGTPVVININR